MINIWNLSWWQQLCDVSKQARTCHDSVCSILFICTVVQLTRRSSLHYRRIVRLVQERFAHLACSVESRTHGYDVMGSNLAEHPKHRFYLCYTCNFLETITLPKGKMIRIFIRQGHRQDSNSEGLSSADCTTSSRCLQHVNSSILIDLFPSFFLELRRPNLIMGLIGWWAPDCSHRTQETVPNRCYLSLVNFTTVPMNGIWTDQNWVLPKIRHVQTWIATTSYNKHALDKSFHRTSKVTAESAGALRDGADVGTAKGNCVGWGFAMSS